MQIGILGMQSDRGLWGEGLQVLGNNYYPDRGGIQ